MKTGTMDMFCGGEPSAMRAIAQKVGYTAVTVGEIVMAFLSSFN
jgi:ABC-type nitrate/sulfonate/bicarbonate transport system substrate-binding protein